MANTGIAPADEELLKLIVESAHDFAIFSTDQNGLVTSWNSGAERLLGYSAREIMGRSADVIFPLEEGGAAAAEQERRTASEHGRALDERWQIRKDGSKFWASGLLIRLNNPAAGYAKILRDLTEHHLKDVELRDTAERFQLLATNIPQLVFRSRSNGDRTWGSPQWIEFTGLSLGASIEYGWVDAIHPEDRDATMRAWQEAQRTGAYYAEHRVRRGSDGAYRWHQTRARPILTGGLDESEWVGTMADVHDMRQLQDVQRVLMAELQHRTRNLLAIVQAIATEMLRKKPTVEQFAHDFGARLHALGRVQALTTRIGLDDAPTSLRDLIEVEIRAHVRNAEDLDRIDVDGPPVALPQSATLPIGLALHELTTNAFKYGALAQPNAKLSVKWHLNTQGSEPQIHLEWIESGVSLPAGAPQRMGYGRQLIEHALPYQLGTESRFEIGRDGARCSIIVPLKNGESREDGGGARP